MELIRRGKARTRVGLDIGKSSVKLVELSGGPDKPSLVAAGVKRIDGASGGAAVAIKALADELGVSSKEAVISVSGSSLIVRLITMPRMGRDELASAIRFETEKFIPFDINDCILDYHIMAGEAKDKANTDILLAAAKKDLVTDRMRSAADAGFTVRAVDADIIALTNAYLKNFPPADMQKTTALINVGASSTDLSILAGATPVFVREIGMGGGDFSSAIAKKSGIGPAQAEELKISPRERLEEVISSTKGAVGALIDEVKMSFGYYENQSGKGVDEVYLSGGGAEMAGLEEAFGEMLGSRPVRWDPFSSIDKSQSRAVQDLTGAKSGIFCVAVGLALR